MIILLTFKTLIMKNLKIKMGLFSLLAILAVSVFLTSCEQEVLDSQISDDINQIEMKQELNDLENKIETEATHNKEVVINDEATGVIATLSVSTNVPQLLNFYNENNLKLKVGETLEADAYDRNGIATETDNNEFTTLDKNANIVEIRLLNISSTTGNVEDIPAISFKFEDELRQALKENNAGILLNLEGDSMSRGTSYVYGRSTRMRSDGSNDGRNAKARVYYRYNNGNYLGNRYGSFYWCLTSKVTNWGYSCYSAYIYKIYSCNDVVWITMYNNCGASC